MEQSTAEENVGITTERPKMDLCFAQVKVKPFRYRWTIKNVKCFYDEKKTVESPVFCPSGNEDNVVDLYLRANPSSSTPDDHLSLFLVNNSDSKMSVKFKVAVTDSKGENVYEKGNDVFYDIEAGLHRGWEEFIGWEGIFQESEGRRLLVNDELEIICSGAIFDGLFCPSNPVEMCQFEKNEESQRGNGFDFQQLGLGRFFDVTLLVGQRSYQCHKSVLAAGSSDLFAMLEHTLKTQQRIRLEITDVDAEVVERLLEYFYTGKVNGIEKIDEKLLPAANKYGILDLKTICEKEIALKLSVKNAARILLLADRHSSKELKTAAVELICGNCIQVLQTEGWKELAKLNPELIVEIFEALAVAHEAEIGGFPVFGCSNNQIESVTASRSASRDTIADNSKRNRRTAQVKVKPFSYTWTIKDFTSFYNDMRTIESPTFSVYFSGETAEFRLAVEPWIKSSKEYLGIFISNYWDWESNLYATYEFAVIGSNGEKVFYERALADYHRLGEIGVGWRWNDFIRWEDIFNETNGLLVNDELTIRCNGEVFDGKIPNEPRPVDTIQLTREFQKTKDFRHLLESGRFSDVTLVVGKEEFLAHKVVLANSSSVFSAIFEHNSEKEQREKGHRLEITDVDADTVRDLLKFIYTGEIKDIVKVAEKLLAAADKFAVEQLKAICEEEILSKLSEKNAARILLLGHMHSSKELKIESMEICSNFIEVSEIEATWNELGMSNADILETFEALDVTVSSFESLEATIEKRNLRSAQVNVTPFRFTWTIKDFTSFYKEKRKVESPTFSVAENGVNADLGLLAKPCFECPTEYLSVFIRNYAKSNNHISFEFAVIGSNGEKEFSKRTEPDYDRVGKIAIGWDNFIRWEDIFKESSGLLVNDELTILCNGEIFDGRIPSEPRPVDTIQLQREVHSKNFGDLLESGRFSDVTLAVGKEEFSVHKAVLANSSTVFSAMFEQEHRDKGDRLEIRDVDADIFGDLLKFIYTGQIKDIVRVAEKLLVTAQNYAVLDLKDICEEEILSKLSVINAARIYLLGHLHSSNELKTEAMKLICGNPRQVSQTEEWKSLAKSNPELILEAFEALAAAHQEEVELSSLTVC